MSKQSMVQKAWLQDGEDIDEINLPPVFELKKAKCIFFKIKRSK
jgi:hypothetical protein